MKTEYLSPEEQLIHDICVFEERIIDYRSQQNPPDAIEIAKLEIRQKRAVEMYKEDICKKYTDTFWFDVFNERYPDEVKEILDGRMSGPDF